MGYADSITTMTNPLTPRDYIAIPFLFLGLLCDTIAVRIGGRWTCERLLYKEREKQIELTNNFTDSNGEQMPLDTALHISYILSSLKEREKQHD